MLINQQNLIKGTITIIYKPKIISWFNNWFTSQQHESQTKTHVILSFDPDQGVVDLIENKILFESTKDGLNCNGTLEFTEEFKSSVPLYYSSETRTYFRFCDNYDEKPSRDKQLKLIFSDNITSEIDPSFYNCMFYYKNYNKCDDINIVLTIRKLKFGSDSHRYLFAYDSDEFSRDQIQIILYYIFCLEK